MTSDAPLYADHPAAAIFPLLEGPHFDALCADMDLNGQREPIVIYEGKVLDGRNRMRAAAKNGVAPSVTKYNGDDPVAFVVSLNLHRRHLNESQRAMVAARLADVPQGARSDLSPIGGKSQPEAAAMLNVSPRAVSRASKVQKDAAPEVVAAVDAGAIPVSLGAQLCDQDPEFQREVVERVQAGDGPIEAIRKTKSDRIASPELAPPSGKYRVIYADPPWEYGFQMPPGSTSARDYYPTMSIKELCAMPVVDMAEDDAVLFMWTTSPQLELAFQVVRAWGFTYKASFVWDKEKHNVGHYNSVRHEFLLVCVRGSCQPDVRKLFDSVVTEERREHSRKPDVFYEIIETIYTKGARVELFARQERDGWNRWGYEADA